MKFLGRHGLDVFLVALAAGQGSAILLTAGNPRFAGAGLAAAAMLALLMRRFNPLAAGVAALLANGACLFVLGDAPTVVFFGLLSTFAIVAAINTVRNAVISWLVGAGLVGLSVWLSAPPAALADFGLTLGLCTVMWVVGLLLSRRTRQAELLAIRVEVSEQERRHALAEERARIARELHDVVSHGLTVVVLQTLAARTLTSDLPGEELRTVDRHLESVEEAARDALADMRRMLGLLETTPAPPRDARPEPVPQLRDLAELSSRARKAGLAVDDSAVDAGVQLPAALELTVFRIVQEALTNAIKYAPGSRVTVRVAVLGASLHIEVTDDGGPFPARPVTDSAPKGFSGGGVDGGSPGVGARGVCTLGVGGRGLLGMRERAAAYDGTLEAGPLESGGFRVRAELPLDASASRAPSSFLGWGAS